jgi:hypothetical protein
MDTYHPSAKLHPERAEALVVHCSDNRFQAAVQEFLNSHLKLDGNYDVLAIPGGPQCLTLVEYLPKFSWASGKWFRFLIEKHELKRLILIAHQDCSWYRELPFHLFGSTDPRTRQEDDLRRARRTLVSQFPHVRVDLYYVAWDTDSHVTIESVPG